MKTIAYNIVSILLVLLTAYMIYADKQHWGWVLFCAILMAAYPSITTKSKKKQ